MRTSPLRLEQIADPENLRAAFLRAARGKAPRAEVIAFRTRLDAGLAQLHAEILSGTATARGFTRFRIFEPKERVIHAPCFRDRVLHHALVGLCEPEFERRLIADSYACRRGKGREAALRRAEHYAARHTWFLKLDVAKYFDSIPHATLIPGVAARFRDPRIVALWTRLIRAHETAPGRGLPIGALTSQHLANSYLAPVDRLVKETLLIPGYARDMDDMILWSDDRATLNAAKSQIETLLAARGLRLKATWHLQPTARGADFLGYRVFPFGSRLARPSRRRFLRRWAWLERARELGAICEAEGQRRALALTAFVRVARREPLRRRLFGAAKTEVGHRAPTASTAAAVGTTPPPTAALPTATTTSRATATTTSVSGSPSCPGSTRRRKPPLTRPVSRSGRARGADEDSTAALCR